MKKLQDKVVIVTGGGQGIGEAICHHMANEGACVVAADINVERVNKVANEISATGERVLAVEADITKMQDAKRIVESAIAEFGGVNILVNNAGTTAWDRRTFFHESTEDLWDYIIAVNLTGLRNCSRAVIEHMMEKQTGRIISMASIAGVIGSSGKGVEYSAAKAGVIGFTKALAKEVAAHGINVNCISPGLIETAVLASQPQEIKDSVKRNIYVGRLGQPDDIAGLVVFLASNEGSFITGQNFIVDGGITLGP